MSSQDGGLCLCPFNCQPLCGQASRQILYIGSVFTNPTNQTAIIMKLLAKDRFARLWIMLLFTSLSMVTVSAVSSAVTIGEEYRGGIVFYVDGTGQHGLVAAKEDIRGHSPGRNEWCFTWYDAKAACNNLVRNGYSDWFLPNRWQLNQLYLRKDDIGGFSGISGYWSSTEGSADSAWYQIFDTSTQDQHQSDKTASAQVRAVRAF